MDHHLNQPEALVIWDRIVIVQKGSLFSEVYDRPEFRGNKLYLLCEVVTTRIIVCI
jgi:hypothetical protein